MTSLNTFQNATFMALNRLFQELGFVPHKVEESGGLIIIQINHIEIYLYQDGAGFQGKGISRLFNKEKYPLAQDQWDFELLQQHLLRDVRKYLLDPNLKDSPFSSKQKIFIMGVLFLLSSHWGIKLYGVLFHDVMGDRHELSIKLTLAFSFFLILTGKWLFFDNWKR